MMPNGKKGGKRTLAKWEKSTNTTFGKLSSRKSDFCGQKKRAAGVKTVHKNKNWEERLGKPKAGAYVTEQKTDPGTPPTSMGKGRGICACVQENTSGSRHFVRWRRDFGGGKDDLRHLAKERLEDEEQLLTSGWCTNNEYHC